MILKRKNSKFWQYRFMVSGKLYTGSTGTTDKEQAKKFEKKLREELKGQKSVKGLVENFRNELAGVKPIAIEKVFDRFLKAPKEEELTGHHLKVTRSFWQDFVVYVTEEHHSVKTLNNVSKVVAEGYLSHLRTEGRYQKTIAYSKTGKRRGKVQYKNKNKQLSPRTINGYHKACQYIWDVLLGDSELRNPFKDVKKLKMKNKTEHREPFTSEELENIGTKAPNFVYAIFKIGLLTGLREGDICTLRWHEVDMQQLIIRRRMEKTGDTVEIPILDSLSVFLKSLPVESEYVLPEHEKLYRSNSNAISYRVKQFLKSVNIKTTRNVEGRTRAVTIKDVHSLRHNFCHIAAQQRVPLNVIQSIVGHMDADLTKMYADHFNRDQKRSALEDVPDYLGSPNNLEIRSEITTTGKEEQAREQLIEIAKTAPLGVLQELIAVAKQKSLAS